MYADVDMQSRNKALSYAISFLVALLASLFLMIPQTAYARELMVQSSSNNRIDTAMELNLGESYSGTFEGYSDMQNILQNYWFKFQTGDYEAEYTFQLDSLSGETIRMQFYDERGNLVIEKDSWTNYNTYWYKDNTPTYCASTMNTVSCTKSDLEKNTWCYARVIPYYASKGDMYRIAAYERKVLSSENVSLDNSLTGIGNYGEKAASATFEIKAPTQDDKAPTQDDNADTITQKKTNLITVKAKKVTFSASKVKKKAQSVKAAKAFIVKKKQGKVTYKATANVTKNAMKKVKVASNGKITVKKGTKTGTYKLKVKITTAGNATYKGGSKIVTLAVKVK